MVDRLCTKSGIIINIRGKFLYFIVFAASVRKIQRITWFSPVYFYLLTLNHVNFSKRNNKIFILFFRFRPVKSATKENWQNFIQIFNFKDSIITLEVFKQCSALKACQKKRKLVHWVQFRRSFKLEIFRYKFNAPKNHDLFCVSWCTLSF